MSTPRYAELAKRALRQATEDAAFERTPESDQRGIAAVEQALRDRSRRHSLRRAAAIVGALAAAASVAIGITHVSHVGQGPSAASPAPSPSAPVIVVHASGDGADVVGGTPVVGGSDQALAAGARVVALPHGHALLAFSTGTKVNVDEGGDVAIVSSGPAQILALGGGALRADVAKLKQGERFIVRTVDAEIEVHGTSFRVATVASDPSCGNGTRTRLTVFEGIVTIRSSGTESRIGPQGVWPAGCANDQTSTPSPTDSAASLPAPSARLGALGATSATSANDPALCD